jgi:hypothetical protein
MDAACFDLGQMGEQRGEQLIRAAYQATRTQVEIVVGEVLERVRDGRWSIRVHRSPYTLDLRTLVRTRGAHSAGRLAIFGGTRLKARA